ncbi:MAG: hypothetical protein VB056_03595 [Sphaerochaeta associata]|uniref:hypothetical protein n=1 Tax=Sphaerochaeta associata TaxID=1129264 RepID=UPI002B1EBDA9|nr:hypothetical protein [Sphaerochaeta associata]MEA5027940.1 hypothetical protein [Sphaerochaeta associata]
MKRFVIALLCLTLSYPLFSYTVTMPDFVVAHAPISVSVAADAGDAPVEEARFYFKLPSSDLLTFVPLTLQKDVWTAEIPAQFIVPGTLFYFAEVKGTDASLLRLPLEGYRTLAIEEAEKVPELELAFPKDSILSQGTDQILLVRLPYEIGISSMDVTLGGEPITIIASQNVWITLRAKPMVEGSQPLELTIRDKMGFEWKQVLDVMIEPTSEEPWFTIEGEYFTDASAAYEAEILWDGDDIEKVGYDDDFPVEVTIGGTGRLKLGPLGIMVTGNLNHKDSVLGVVDSLPDVLIADYQDLLHMWNPLDFENEFTFNTDRVRQYDSGNIINLKLDLFNGFLTYEFGDQEITLQEHTIKNLGFRGTSISLNVSPFRLTLAKGLSDKGLHETAWPQQFIGIQSGLWFKRGFSLQGNLSFITDFQGRFDDIKGLSINPMQALYKLEDVAPKQNMVMGLSSGYAGEALEISGDLAFSMYVSDSSGVVDIQQMVAELASGFEINTDSLDPYFKLLNDIHSVFPILDYFPINMGLIGTAVDRELWGMMYSLKFKYIPWNLELWFYKADKMYRSLGASAPNDVLDIGTSWKQTVHGGDLVFDYSYKRNSIPDILLHDFLSIVLSQDLIDLISLPNPFADDAKFTQTAKLEYTTQKLGFAGVFGLAYTAAYEYTNDVDTLFALTSDKNSSLKNTLEGSWNGGPYTLGEAKTTIDLKVTANYNQPFIVSSIQVSQDDWFWDFTISNTPKFEFGDFKIKLGFKQTWSMASATYTKRQYELGFQLPKSFIDTWNITAKVNETSLAGSLQSLAFEVGTDLAKQIAFLQLKIELTAAMDYDASKESFDFDQAKAMTTVKGSFSF